MCQTIERNLLVSREANGREFEVNNPARREIGVLEVDGCLIADHSRRVDWAVELPAGKKLRDGTRAVKLIELKGRNVMHAFSQLESTMNHQAMSPYRPLIDEGFIVTQLSPSIVSSVQVAVIDFQDRFGIPVRVVPRAKIEAEE